MPRVQNSMIAGNSRQRRHFSPALAFVVSLAFVQSAFSQPQLVLREAGKVYSLAGHFDYLLDPSHEKTVDEINSPPLDSSFRPYGNRNPEFGIIYDALWLRFTVQDSSSEINHWILECTYPCVSHLKLYYKDRGEKWITQETGGDVRFEDRVLQHRKPIFQLPPVWERKEFYLRVYTQSSTTFPLRIVSETALAAQDRIEYFFFGIFNGILILMFLYNFFLYLSVRESAYLAYCAYIVSYGIYQSLLDGTGQEFLFRDITYPTTTIAIVFVWLSVGASCFFAVKYLRLEVGMPTIAVLMTGCSIVFVSMALYTSVGDMRLSNNIVNRLALVLPVLQLGIGIARWRQGFKPAKFYFLATLGYVGGFYIRVLRNFGLFPNTELAMVSMQIGIVWEFAILSFGLANRIKTIKVEEARERERMRERISSDLHDEIGSSLSSIAVSSQMMKKRLYLRRRDRIQLDDIAVAARETADAMRDIVWFVNPLHDPSCLLAAKMKDTASSLLADLTVRMDLDEKAIEDVKDLQVRRNIFLIFKECLNNIVRHARATAVELNIRKEGNALLLLVSDDGVGFDIQTVKENDGLRNMRTRARQIGADVDIETFPQLGTRIRVMYRIP